MLPKVAGAVYDSRLFHDGSEVESEDNYTGEDPFRSERIGIIIMLTIGWFFCALQVYMAWVSYSYYVKKT